jgi:2,3,4,5-tetrahydropyridine-2-carboxylate N-succinyltransferase
MADVFAFGIGLSTYGAAGNPVETFFPVPMLNPPPALAAATREFLPLTAGELAPDRLAAFAEVLSDNDADQAAAACRDLSEAERPLSYVCLAEDAPIASTTEAYLKLHLLSHRLSLPNTLNLEGIFAHLPTLAWTNLGPLEPAAVPTALMRARINGAPLHISSLDKFPRMTDYVVPTGVRIANTSRVRLGAYVGDGSTVMPEGQINYNAGSLGPNMIEGRISQAVILGANTDLGGGSSTMGTLSGGGKITVAIGEHCLIGANGGTGIGLGDRCTIEAGLYITAGTRVTLIDTAGNESRQVKAAELAGLSDLLFIRHSRTGVVQCRSNQSAIELNDALHAHN